MCTNQEKQTLTTVTTIKVPMPVARLSEAMQNYTTVSATDSIFIMMPRSK
jgi:hypothetical protein